MINFLKTGVLISLKRFARLYNFINEENVCFLTSYRVNNHYVYRKLINEIRAMTNVSSLILTYDAYITYQQNRLKDNKGP